MRARLIGRLVRQGVDEDAAEEICQRVALRAVRYGVALPPGTRLFDWAKRVAHQEAIASRRTAEPIDVSELVWQDEDQAGVVPLGDDPLLVDEEVVERASGYDLYATLTENDRGVLRDLATGRHLKADRPSQKRFAVQLHRLRERLAARAEELGDDMDKLTILLWLRVGSLRWRMEQSPTALAMTAVLGVSLTVGLSSQPSSGDSAEAGVTSDHQQEVSYLPGARSPSPLLQVADESRIDRERVVGSADTESDSTGTVPDWPLPHQRVAVDHQGNGASVGTSPNTPDRPFVCLETGGVTKRQCVGKLFPPPDSTGQK